MRTVATVGLILLASVLVQPAEGQIPPPYTGDYLVVPGQRIGAARLQMTLDELTAAFGRPRAITSMAIDAAPGLRTYAWPEIRIEAWTRDGQTILLLEVDANPEFATEKGVRWGLPRADVERAYGQPTRVTQWRGNGIWRMAVNLWYDDIGLNVFFDPSGSADAPTSIVRGMGVFRPGTASSLWKP